MNYELKDLVILKYAPNQCWTQVVDAFWFQQGDFDIFPENGEWKFRGNIYPIGKSRHIDLSASNEVIGVYDKTSTEQLSSMTHDAITATKEKPNLLEI